MISIAKIDSLNNEDHLYFYQVDEGGMMDFAALTLRKTWSAIVWDGGYRARDNFLSCGYLMLDIDTGHRLGEYCEKLKALNLAHFITTTRSHGLEKGGVIADRFRVVIKMVGPVTDVDHYTVFMGSMVSKFKGADSAAKDGARKYLPGREIIQVMEGRSIDAGVLPKNHVTVSEKNRSYSAYLKRFGESRIIPPWIRAGLNNGFTNGERNAKTFKLACDMVRMNLQKSEIESLILNSKIGLPPCEVETIVSKAIRYNR